MELGTEHMEPGKGFRQLLAWQKSDDLVAQMYQISKSVRPFDKWLAAQIWHAAYSVTANIAEGYGRSSLPDYLRFLEIAGGSLNEVENALHVLRRNEIVPIDQLQEAEILREASGNLLFGLMRSLRRKSNAGEAWHRGIREQRPDYDAGAASEFPVPSSEFQQHEDSSMEARHG